MLSLKKRKEIYDHLKSLGSLWGKWPSDERHLALDKIWDLRTMSSSDSRYRTAYEDARKHVSLNDDWDDDHTFLDRFHLLESSEEEFLKFLNFELSSEVRTDSLEITKYCESLGGFLPKGYSIVEVVKEEGGSEFVVKAEISEQEDNSYPVNLTPNEIPFFVNETPDSWPSFKLEYDNWDDFGYKTTFRLHYYLNEKNRYSLGIVKILAANEPSTIKVIPRKFTTLPLTFCSLGMQKMYYSELSKHLPEKYESVLYALKDSAWFSEIRYKFENRRAFNSSLLRNRGSLEVLTGIRRSLLRCKNEGSWDFTFRSDFPYANEKVDITFNFGNLELKDNHRRIQALIGPNGAGKTSVLKTIVKSLIREEFEDYITPPPVFSKVIAISFSIFDTFFTLHGKSVLTYSYCGLHDRYNTVMSEEDRKTRLREALIEINKDERSAEGPRFLVRRFLAALKIVFPAEWVDNISEDGELNVEKIISKYDTMSSGETMILSIVASLYSQIRHNTLIVFDELEVHLHPKAIRQMISLLFKITKEFESACILATHSAIVVQELLADNITILEKDSYGKPCTRMLNRESLAENLSVISNEIFGESDISPHYRSFIKNQAEEAASLEELLSILSSRGLPPSLPLYLLARDYFPQLN